MSNLQPLPWTQKNLNPLAELELTAHSALHEYVITEPKQGKFEIKKTRLGEPDKKSEYMTGFTSVRDAKDEAWAHYNRSMQPYVVPAATWISVDDRLPDELKTVLIIYEAELNFKPRKFMSFALREGGDWLGIDDMFGGYVFDDEYNADKFNDDLHGFNITHWMPIPEFSNMQNLHKGE